MRIKSTTILIFISLFFNNLCSQNLLTNGDFEIGGNGVGFSLNGTGYNLISAPFSGTTNAGDYAFTANPLPMNTSNFIAGTDHTSGTGNMMVIDGNSTGGSQRFWRAGNTGGGVCGLTVGQTYTFSYWIKSVSTNVVNAATSADIGIQFNNTSSFALLSGNTQAPLPANGWQKVVYEFVPTNPCVNIELWNNNLSFVGNDFAVDDFSVFLELSLTYTSTNETCPNLDNGSITITGVGGVTPYVSYSISGQETDTNTTGIFTGLEPGTYNLTVTDFIGDTFTLTGVNINASTAVLPTAAFTVPGITVCPGVASTANLIGTPNAIVLCVYNGTNIINGFLNAAGTGTIIIPGLQQSTTITISNVSIFGGCINTSVVSSLTVTVVPNGCAVVIADGDPTDTLVGYVDPNICGVGDCRTLTATYSDVASTTSYAVSPIPYCPQAPYQNIGNGWIQLYPDQVNSDDEYSGVFTFPAGMQFCFFGQNYNQVNVGTNGVIKFPNPTPLAQGAFCPWAFNQTIPNATFPILNAIFGVYQDTNYAVTPTPPAVISANYRVIGTYPCRKFIANFANLPQFSCNNSVGLQTSQIVLYEVSNIIEVYVERRTPCPGWNGGRGTIGIINGSGANAYAAPGRNASQFSTDPTPANSNNSDNVSEAWRFTPTGPNVPTTFQWLENGNPYSNSTTITVCPTADVTYTAETTYTVCGVQQTATTNVDLFFYGDLTQQPQNITQCSNIFDLTVNDATILGALNPGDYTISYHLTFIDAQNGANALTLTQAQNHNIANGSTIYVYINYNALDCTFIKQFNLIVSGTLAPTISCGNLTITSVEFTWPGVAGATDYIVSYQVNANPIINIGSIGNVTSYIINGLNSGDNVTITVLPDNAIAPCYVSSSFTCSTTPCGTISNPVGSQSVCVNGTPSPISVDTSEVSTDAISFVYFATQQIGNTMYTGGIPLGLETPVGTSPNATATYIMPALGSIGSIPNTPGTYYIYALFNPTPTDPLCRPFQEIVINVIQAPTAGTDGNTTVCENTGLINLFSLITGEQAGGTWIRTSGTGGTFVALTGTFTPTTGATTSTFEYEVSGVTPCPNDISIATVTIIPLPTATISGTATICFGSSTTITFNGTPNATVTYTINAGTNQTISLNATGTASITTPALTVNTTYALVSVATTGLPSCTQTQAGTAVVTIIPLPTATITGTVAVCSGSSTTITFNGTPNATVTYTINAGSNQTISLNAAGTASIITPALSVNTTYALVSVTTSGSPGCTQAQVGSAVVTIVPLPTATISGSTAVCPGSTTTITFNGTPNATVTYTINAGANQTIVLNAAGTASLTTPALSVNTTYGLVSVATSGLPICSQTQVGSAIITILPLPTATITSSTPSVCLNFASPIVTLSGFTGAAPYTFVYTVNGGAPITSPPSTTTFDINVPTTSVGPITYCLVSVTDGNGCTQNSSQCVTVTVLTAPIINTPLPYPLCDDDSNDGVACFDLVTVVTPQVTSNATLIVTYHETFTDAQTGANPQVSPYCNINNLNNQILYIRVFDPFAPQCYATTQVQLIVNPKPTAVEPTDLHVCDNGDAQLGFVLFDLTVKESEILGSINPATHSVTYYETLGDAQLQVSPIVNPTIYTNTVVNTQTIWVVVETTATGCFDIVELQLVVDPLPLVNQPAACLPYTLCETGGAVGFEVFDLQTRVGCILLGQLGMSVTFYPSLTQAQSNTGAITNLNYTNGVAVVQTLGIRVTNVQTGCYVISTMDIRVEPLPVPIAPLTPYTVCDTDQNGLFEFDLTTLTAGILGANPTGNTLTYHETQTDAQLGTNSINTALPYSNLFAFSQTLWVAVVNPITLCRAVMPIQLRVNQSPRMPDLDDIVYCDEDSNNQNASTLVNLSQQTALILAAQTVPPASNYTVTYYRTLIDAQLLQNNIVPTTSYTGTNGETIYVVVRNNTTGCIKIGQFQIIINIPLALVQPAALSVCDDDAQPNNGFTTFDLTVRDLVITSGMSAMGYTVTYYPSYANALAGINQIINPTAYINISPAVQTLGVKVTSPDGCRSYITMDIRVLPVPTPNTTNIPILPPQCEDVLGSGQQFFDLTVNENYILNGDPNVTAHYFHTLANATAVPPVNEIPNPSLAYIGNPLGTPRPVNEIQYIYIAVTSNIFTEYTGANCYTIVRQPFIVNPLPIANAIGVQQICEEDPAGNDGIEEFDLTSYTGLLLAGNNTTPLSTYVVTFYTDAGLTNQIANPSAYNNTSNPQTIYVRVTTTTTYVDPVTGITYSTSCSSVTNFDIIVNPKPSITQPAAPLATCDNSDGINDGYQLYSLASLEAELLNGQNPTLFTVTFYQSEYNPDATPPLLPPAIANTTNFPVYTHTFWAAVTNNATGCFKTLSFNIVVEQTPEPFITNNPNLNVICVDFISGVVVRDLLLESENQTIPYLNEPMVPRPTYTYQWYEDGVLIPGATSDTYLIDQPLNDNESSIFTLIMTSQSILGCSAESQDYLVLQSGQAIPAAGTIGYTVTNAFSENQIITVTVEGYGTYQYSLDDGPRQDSPIFENVSLGEHIITVWDTEGGLDYSCDPLIIDEVQTIDYPHYFTPNGDGIHDYWNIVGLEGQPTAKIYIFDRHGKLIKQISSQSEGWDGTYNGQQMFSTDYWFTVDYSEQGAMKKFRAHFALKR